MKLIEIQLAWFFSSPQNLDYEKIASTLRANMDVDFMQPSMILPIPPSAPAEIPRLQMNAQDGSNRLSLGPIRGDFFSSATSEGIQEDDIARFKSNTLAASSTLSASGAQISRIGVVARLIHETSNASKIIQNAFLRDTTRNIKELSLRLVERHSFEGDEYNDSLQYDDGTRMPDNAKVLIVTRDINTAPERLRNMSPEQIQMFLGMALPQFSDVIIASELGIK